MRDRAAERAACPDRAVRDVMRDLGEEFPERAFRGRLFECGVAHRGADEQPAVLHRKPVEAGDAVDIDQMARPRQAERHGGHQALPAGQHAAVIGCELREQRDGFLDGFRRVILEWRGLHCRCAA